MRFVSVETIDTCTKRYKGQHRVDRRRRQARNPAKHGHPETIITDRLRSYGAALKELGALDRQETGRWLNNRAENSHLPFRRRERAMQRFRRLRSLQMFVSIHASVTNHFNSERSLTSRSNFKLNRNAALAEWRQLLAG
ncbi:MAG: DDE-type integrase/transposase/recombinase [Marivivens sp.]